MAAKSQENPPYISDGVLEYLQTIGYFCGVEAVRSRLTWLESPTDQWHLRTLPQDDLVRVLSGRVPQEDLLDA